MHRGALSEGHDPRRGGTPARSRRRYNPYDSGLIPFFDSPHAMSPPLKVALQYALFGAAWILLGDLWMLGTDGDHEILGLSIGKGLLFVGLSTG